MYEFDTLDPYEQVVAARCFAIAAHSAIGQKRKFGEQEDYWHHCERVAAILEDAPTTTDQVCAAYLHDVLEDTQVTEATLREVFGDRITNLVVELTDVSKPKDGNRAARKALDREHSLNGSVESVTVKLADLLDNTRSIVQGNPDFARVYLPEKIALLIGFMKQGKINDQNRGLYNACWDSVYEAKEVLEV